MNKIGLLGAGAQAKELADYCQEQGLGIDFVAVDHIYFSQTTSPFEVIDIEKPSQARLLIPVITAIGAPAVKKAMIELWPGQDYARVIGPNVWVSRTAELGEGVLISPGSQISTNVKIGDHVLINLGVNLSHDVEIGEYSTISPGATLGGRVRLGKGVFVGIGATIKNDVEIADGTVIGAGAVVLDSIESENTTVVGIPAKEVSRRGSWLSEIK